MDGALSFAEKITTDFLGTLLIASMVARVHAYRKDKTPMLFVLLISFVVSIVNWLMLDFQLSLILETAATSCMIGFLVAVLPTIWYVNNNFSEGTAKASSTTFAIASLCGLVAGAAKLIRPFP